MTTVSVFVRDYFASYLIFLLQTVKVINFKIQKAQQILEICENGCVEKNFDWLEKTVNYKTVTLQRLHKIYICF